MSIPPALPILPPPVSRFTPGPPRIALSTHRELALYAIFEAVVSLDVLANKMSAIRRNYRSMYLETLYANSPRPLEAFR